MTNNTATTLKKLLVATTGKPVLFRLLNGYSVRGVLTHVGDDYVRLQTSTKDTVIVPTHSIVLVKETEGTEIF